MIDISQKEAFIFDLDGTLAESKQALDPEMGALLKRLLEVRKVAVITGGSWSQIQRQFAQQMPADSKFDNLFLFPTSGTAFYRRTIKGWQEVYSEKLAEADRQKIRSILLESEARLGMTEPHIYGERVEDRGSQITYSALGQDAPVDVKKAWDPDQSKRRQIVALAAPFLTGFTVGIGGMTSIDVTKGGSDKGLGVQKVAEALDIPISKMVFIGDALYPGGNDYPARSTGIDCVEVAGPKETKEFIEKSCRQP
jgi:phosphomannomutase